MSLNPFFQANAINTYKSANFSSSQTTFQPSTSIKKVKRISSLSSAKLNPQKFTLRQAFNSKMYPQKMFNISVQFNKQPSKISNNKTAYKLQNLQSHFRGTTKQQYKKLSATFQNSMANVNSYFRNIQNPNGKDQIGKNELTCLNQVLQKIFKAIQRQFTDKQSRYAELLFKSKMQPSVNLKQSRFQLMSLNTQDQDFKKYNMEKKIKDLSQKLKKIQFQNSKLKLLCQNLTSNIQKTNYQFFQISKQNNLMKQRLSKVKEGQQFLEYKIKKLKQQLQVAHIVKQQNLAQKMKYIMSFQ